MTADIIDPNYTWQKAAAQEGVDYGAVQKAFMDQSYGVVANKAKILFQDPFRLGFEIVNRNEKATKMVGIFAFRVNKHLLYAPTFFVNGEIKAADMLYRAKEKRFVPLTEDWCAYLVRGVEEQAGDLVDKNRRRQSDAYMDRLAYPQRVKYASEEDFAMTKVAGDERMVDAVGEHGYDIEKVAADNPGLDLLVGMDDAWATEMIEARNAFVKAAADGSLWHELLLHSADNSPMRKLIPEVINECGPEALEKVAAFVGDSDVAARHLASHYTREELETVDAWMAKEASDDGPQPAIAVVINPNLSKSAAERARVFDKGYALVDSRPAGSINTVVEELESEVIKELSSPGKVSVMLNSGETENAYLFRRDPDMLSSDSDPYAPVGWSSEVACLYFPKSKEILRLRRDQDVFGDELADWDKGADNLIAVKSLKPGKCYVAVSDATRAVSDVFRLEDRTKDGAAICLTITDDYGDERKVYYAPNRGASKGTYLSDDTQFLEVKCDVEFDEGVVRRVTPTCDKAIMSGGGLDEWMRTAGGLTSSNDVRVKGNPNLTFDVEHRVGGTLIKSARDLGMLEAHLKIAEDFCLTTDKAGEILDKAADKDVTYRVYDSLEKEAFLTRTEGMEDWIQSFDPELNVRLDAPQYQILTTFTPRRSDQQSRYGDTYQRVPTDLDKRASLLPIEAVMSQPPEQLAQMSEMYDLPHIFDHACVGRMATTSHNIVEQIKRYVPDLETGVDRYFRILFLLRYRPSDFEEIYGKDDLIEFEDDLTELAARAGEQLLTLLQQFEPDQYSSQEN